MTNSSDVSALPMWFKLVLLFAGAILMLTGADLIPADPARFHAPHWVVFVAGVAFSSTGAACFLARDRAAHPARYLFAIGILVTCLFLVCVAASIYASGGVIGIGPISIKGAAADEISRFMYGIGALIVGALALAVWSSWYRTMKSPNP